MVDEEEDGEEENASKSSDDDDDDDDESEKEERICRRIVHVEPDPPANYAVFLHCMSNTRERRKAQTHVTPQTCTFSHPSLLLNLAVGPHSGAHAGCSMAHPV